MVNIQLIAAILLLARIASDIFIFLVLQRQWHLLKLPISKPLRKFRMVLFALSIAVFLGNVVPIMIDWYTLAYHNPGRPAVVHPISILYAVSNAMTSLASSVLIWTLYQLAARDEDITEFTGEHLADVPKRK